MTTVSAPARGELEAARELVRQVVRHTPLVPARGREDVRLKLETLQAVGCFKLRGVYHAVSRMAPERRAAGISTVSAGNTAKALAWAGRAFGVPARSLMPESAPRTKIAAVEALGGTPVLVPTKEVFRFLKEHAWEQEPFGFVHPWTDRDVLLGHGSMAFEILEDWPEVETVYLPVGGGGLLGGVGGALRALAPEVRIVGVEPAGCPSLFAAREAGHPVEVACDTMCDGVAVPYVTAEMFPLLVGLVDDVVLVEEEQVRAAIRRLALEDRVVAEGSGALAFAAALATPEAQRGRSVAVVTGGSIDAETLADVLG